MGHIHYSPSKELELEKEEYKKIASQLRYSPDVFEKIDRAKTLNELTRIMCTARNKEEE